MDHNLEQAKAGFLESRWLPAVVAVILMLTWLAWALYGVQWTYAHVAPAASVVTPPTVEQLGQVGDLFGGVNALFAAAACAGVLWAGLLQRQALIETRAALKEERIGLERQQFENKFFQMLALTRDITASIEIGGKAGVREGARALESLATVLKASGKQTHAKGEVLLILGALDYNTEIYLKHPSALGPYFRSLFQVFQLIAEASDRVLTESERVRYSKIARGQISDGAVLLLAMNGATKRGEAFVPLIERFGLLEHMHERYQRTWQEPLRLIYSSHAFMGSKQRAVEAALPPNGNVMAIRARIDDPVSSQSGPNQIARHALGFDEGAN